ncbi:helix-turn-helix transcriptional regulator [Mesorhizobium sp. LNHC221B00]|uniref:helix-turn-helix domain-containing protein n=1 Tax=Mesorhizobium sp. LNHC221B00 TaxID=1287233 RepID=UPI0018DD09BD|nr:helix-turn-helix transcriptional regulator [Mesorhizobium sp. LNHC221B00]
MDDKIRAIMAETQWRQQQLAEMLDVGQSTVNRWLAGSEPRGDRRDRINELYERVVENSKTAGDRPIRGEPEILAVLQRIEGLTAKDIEIAFGVISNALKVSSVGSAPSGADDRSQPATPRRESSPSR